MSALDDIMAVTVRKMLDRYGKTIRFETFGKNHYDPESGAVGKAGPIFTDVVATPPQDYIMALGANTTVQSGDMVIGIGPSITPEVQQRVIIDDISWRIVSVGRVYSGEELALYYPIVLRKE